MSVAMQDKCLTSPVVGPDDPGPIGLAVERHLCHGCGTCVSVCPTQALKMKETASGFLVPKIGERCTGCGMCASICPGARLPAGLLAEHRDPFRGSVLQAYLARATDRNFFRNGQSAGVVTALVAHMMRTGRSDGALVTGPVGASARPAAFVASTPEALHLAQGSKYCPVALNAAIGSEEFQRLQRPVVVGLSCHVHGIRCLQRLARGRIAHPPLVLGLICSGVYSFHKIDHLRRAAGLKEANGDFAGLRYKDKASYGWPGDVSVYSKSRGTVRVSARERHLAKAAFRPPRCYLCFDQMNVLSDISFGDPWGISWDADGWTVILTRTEAGQAAVDEAVAGQAITAEPIDAEAVFAGQTVDSRHRRQWIQVMAAWREMGCTPPDFGFSISDADRSPPRRSRRFRCNLLYSRSFFDCESKAAAIRMAQRRIRLDALRQALVRPIKAVRAAARSFRRRPS
jgi:coenzyme F420 hydrogenase subunit beta